jgi:hypothetical protein
MSSSTILTDQQHTECLSSIEQQLHGQQLHKNEPARTIDATKALDIINFSLRKRLVTNVYHVTINSDMLNPLPPLPSLALVVECATVTSRNQPRQPAPPP